MPHKAKQSVAPTGPSRKTRGQANPDQRVNYNEEELRVFEDPITIVKPKPKLSAVQLEEIYKLKVNAA